MAKMNWARQNSQARMQRYGSEDVRGADIPFSAPTGWKSPVRRAPTKADLRAAAATACVPVRKVASVTCPNPACGRTATIAVLLRPDLRFKCSACGSTTLSGSAL
jgi:hypothetical protein